MGCGRPNLIQAHSLPIVALCPSGFLVESTTRPSVASKARNLRRCGPGNAICQGTLRRQVGAKALTMDHVVPIVRGGRSNKGNLVPACKPCNDAKKHRLAFELD
jgi:5-methylcytosine-specific restriction endonuclease McrA